VFKETPGGELTQANCHARISCLKQLLDDVIFIPFNNKKVSHIYTEQLNRMTDCCNKERQRSKNAVFALCDSDRRRLEIALHQCDIPRSGSQGR